MLVELSFHQGMMCGDEMQRGDLCHAPCLAMALCNSWRASGRVKVWSSVNSHACCFNVRQVLERRAQCRP